MNYLFRNVIFYHPLLLKFAVVIWYTGPLSICTWFLKFSSLKQYQFWWTGFFPSLNRIFLPAVACKEVWNRLKIEFIKLDMYFKLENCKSRVQIDKGNECKLYILTAQPFKMDKSSNQATLVVLFSFFDTMKAPFAVYVVYKFAFESNIDLAESWDDKREPKKKSHLV